MSPSSLSLRAQAVRAFRWASVWSTGLIGFSSVVLLAIALQGVGQMTRGMLQASRARDYAAARTTVAFNGLDVDALREGLLGSDPPVTEVAFSSEITHDAFKDQRLTEGLYPVRVTNAAAVTIVSTPGGVAAVSDGMALHLPDRARASPHAQLDWAAIFLHLLAMAGAGAGLATLLSIVVKSDAGHRPLGSWALAGAFLVAVMTIAGSLLQSALPRQAFPFLAVVLAAVAAFATARRRLLPFKWPPIPTALALVLGAAVACVSLMVPIAQWDGRSIWFFRAHEISAHGFLSLADGANPVSIWTHHDYPPLLAALAAFFGGEAGHYSERAAAVAIPVLATASMVQLARILNRASGPQAACWTLLLLFGASWRWWMGGYADSHLAMLLTLEVLALSTPQGLPLGWLAAWSAALLKREGFFLAVLLAAVVLARANPVERKRSIVWALGFVPAIGWAFWARKLGTSEQIPTAASVAHLGDRIVALWSERSWILHSCPLLWVSAAGIGLRAVLNGRPSRLAAGCLLAALVAAGFGLSAVLLSSHSDVRWLIHTAQDRLLLHAAALGCASIFTWTSGPSAAGKC